MTTSSDTRHEYFALLLLSKTANDMGLIFFLLFPHIDPTFLIYRLLDELPLGIHDYYRPDPVEYVKLVGYYRRYVRDNYR